MTGSAQHPIVGGLYRIETRWLKIHDPKPKRPLVVLAVPAYGLSEVPLLARTTQLGYDGIEHPADPSCRCTKNGVFAYRFRNWIDIAHFNVPARATYLGDVDQETFGKILTWWVKR